MSDKNQVESWGLSLLKLAGLMFLLSIVGGLGYLLFTKANLTVGMALSLAIPIAGWFLFIMLLGAVVFGEVMERSHVRGAETASQIAASNISAASQMMDAVGRVMEAGMRVQRDMWTVYSPPPEDGPALPSPEEAQKFLPAPGDIGIVDTHQVEDGSYEPGYLKMAGRLRKSKRGTDDDL